MSHKIEIVIESEKEWNSVCALSSLMDVPVSKIAKDDLIKMTQHTAVSIKEDKFLSAHMKVRDENQYGMLMAILED